MPRRTPIEGKREVLYTYNPGSLDAQFASIHAALETQNKLRDVRMDSQDKLLAEIKTQTELTNGRVTVLEKDRNRSRAWFAGVAATISAGVSGLIILAKSLAALIHPH